MPSDPAENQRIAWEPYGYREPAPTFRQACRQAGRYCGNWGTGPVGFLAMHLARFRGHVWAGGRLRVWPRTKQPLKKTVKKKLAKKRGTPKKKLAKKKPTLKKATVKTKALGKKTTGAKTPAALRTRVRGKSQSVDTEAFALEGLRARGGQSGDLQGLSNIEGADSESVAELIEEGNAFEADAVTGVEHAGDTDEKEVRTHEVPQDDVPGEYLDKE